MPRTPARFTQADIARAIRAIEQSGADVEVILTRGGDMRIVRGGTVSPRDAAPPLDAEKEIRLW